MDLYSARAVLAFTILLAQTMHVSVALFLLRPTSPKLRRIDRRFAIGRFRRLKPWAVLSNHFMVRDSRGHSENFSDHSSLTSTGGVP
jgi:hypothetical protein